MGELGELLKLFKYERGVWRCRVCQKTAHVYEEFCPCQVNPDTEAAIEAGTMSWDDVNRQGYVLTKVICRTGCGRRWKKEKPAPLPAEYYQQ